MDAVHCTLGYDKITSKKWNYAKKVFKKAD